MAFICLGLFLTAEVVFAEPRLSLQISGLSIINGIENLKLVTTVTNIGDSTLKLFNDPRSVLSAMPIDKFVIRDSAGKEPWFTGAIVNFAAVVEDNEGFTILTPGEFIDIEHDCRSSQSSERGIYSLIKPSPSV